MTTLVIPEEITSRATDVWADLNAFISRAQPGDIVQAPKESLNLVCEKPLDLSQVGVTYNFEGMFLCRTISRPYGAYRMGSISPDGLHFTITGLNLPGTCQYGWVSGGGIQAGTHVHLDPGNRSGVLDRPAAPQASVSLTFTSTQDRGACGFNITGKDLVINNYTWYGVNSTGSYVSLLEAQHGTLFAGATNIQINDGNSRRMYGDAGYLSSGNGLRSTFIEINGGVDMLCGRSGFTPVDCADVTISRYTMDHVARSGVDIEPPVPYYHLDRFTLQDSNIGTHRLNFLSSGGSPQAHVGEINILRNTFHDAPMNMWLSVGDANHRRGPYNVIGNKSTFKTPAGGTYPTAALISIENAVAATVTDNTGIVLQKRYPTMAVVRWRNCDTVPVVARNQWTGEGTIEFGPWI